jgi:hypothetical protein
VLLLLLWNLLEKLRLKPKPKRQRNFQLGDSSESPTMMNDDDDEEDEDRIRESPRCREATGESENGRESGKRERA